jgi:hypothetical protein
VRQRALMRSQGHRKDSLSRRAPRRSHAGSHEERRPAGMSHPMIR